MSKTRNSSIELLRIICIIFIIGDHFTGQAGVNEGGNLLIHFFYCTVTSLSRVACSVFIIISAWFLVEQQFRVRRILHIWLTVIMYTVPITLYLYFNGLASKQDLYNAFFPLETSPLWFASYYIILIMISPILNYLLKKQKRLIEIMLFILIVFSSGFSTITGQLGFFSHDIWSLILIYLLTGYIKFYLFIKTSTKKYFICFFASWLGLTLMRAISANYGLVSIMGYCEVYRARMQTIPNLFMAYTLFLLFYSINIKKINIINTCASATLGVYCFHQVPIWYDYLWKNCFKSEIYMSKLHGINRMIYDIVGILIVFIVGTIIELIRSKISAVLIENRKKYTAFCGQIDGIVNASVYTNNDFIVIKKIVLLIVLYICSVLILLNIFFR